MQSLVRRDLLASVAFAVLLPAGAQAQTVNVIKNILELLPAILEGLKAAQDMFLTVEDWSRSEPKMKPEICQMTKEDVAALEFQFRQLARSVNGIDPAFAPLTVQGGAIAALNEYRAKPYPENWTRAWEDMLQVVGNAGTFLQSVTLLRKEVKWSDDRQLNRLGENLHEVEKAIKAIKSRMESFSIYGFGQRPPGSVNDNTVDELIDKLGQIPKILEQTFFTSILVVESVRLHDCT